MFLLGRDAGRRGSGPDAAPGAGPHNSAPAPATKGDGGGPPGPPAWRRPAVRRLAAATLAVVAVTVALHGGVDRFRPDARDWVANPGFAVAAGGEVAGWEREGPAGAVVADGDGTVRLTNRDPEGGVGLRQVLRRAPGDAALFELSATVAAEGIAGGRKGWWPGRVTLAVPEPGGLARGADVELATVRGTRPGETYYRRFEVDADAPEVELALRLRLATGTLVVADLRVGALVEPPWFGTASRVLGVAWALLFAAWLALALRGVAGRGNKAALAALSAGGAALLLLPHGARDRLLDYPGEILLGDLVERESVGQAGHFVLFLALGWLARRLRPRDPVALQLLVLGLAGGAGELAQLLADGRRPTLADWAINASGAALGVATVGLAAALSSRRAAAAAGSGGTGG